MESSSSLAPVQDPSQPGPAGRHQHYAAGSGQARLLAPWRELDISVDHHHWNTSVDSLVVWLYPAAVPAVLCSHRTTTLAPQVLLVLYIWAVKCHYCCRLCARSSQLHASEAGRVYGI